MPPQINTHTTNMHACIHTQIIELCSQEYCAWCCFYSSYCCHSKNYCNKRETGGTTFSCVISIFEKGAPTCSAENTRFLCFKLHDGPANASHCAYKGIWNLCRLVIKIFFVFSVCWPVFQLYFLLNGMADSIGLHTNNIHTCKTIVLLVPQMRRGFVFLLNLSSQ